MRDRLLTTTAWAAGVACLGWVSLFAALAWGKTETIPVPVTDRPGWSEVRQDGQKLYDVYLAPGGYGVIRDTRSGGVTTFDPQQGTWRDNNLNSGTYK